MTGLPPEGWPNRAFSRIETVAPHRWHVQIVGKGPDDVLMLHGAGGSGHSMAVVTEKLQDNYRFIIPDLPGHGFTQSPKGRARLPDVAHDMAALLNQLDVTPSVVIAHSAGAAVALEMVRRNLIAPRALVLINAALEDFRGAAGWLFPAMAKVLALNPFTGLFLSSGGSLSQVRSIIESTGTRLPDDALRPYADLVSRRSHVDGTLAMMAQWSLAELNRALPTISTPTLFVHGLGDKAVDIRVARRASAAMPNAELVELEGVGHLAHEEDPVRVVQEIAAFQARNPQMETGDP